MEHLILLMLIYIFCVIVVDKLPKLFYFVFEGSFLAALISLNWKYLTTETQGKMLLAATVIFTTITIIFFMITGVTDPGFVRS